MHNWERLEADVNLIMNKHFNVGRKDRIRATTLHHNMGNLTVEGCYQVWQTRPASAHYQVESSGRIGQLVWDANTAWACGPGNASTISIEHADVSTHPFALSSQAIENGSHLVGAIHAFYHLGRPEWMKNVFPHSHFMSTECPASLDTNGSQHSQYIARAQYWYDQMTKGSAPAPRPAHQPSYRETVMRLADETIRGEHGNGDARKRSLGHYYNDVQNEVNRRLGAKVQRPSVDLHKLVMETIRGEHGNGEARVRNLGPWYNQVQAEINRMAAAGQL